MASQDLSGCDTTSYPYGKGKLSALKTLQSGNFPQLDDVLGEVTATPEAILEAAKSFVIPLYGLPLGTSPESARYTLFTKNKKSPKVSILPPTSPNLLQHALRAHLQVMLWKAADQLAPPTESADITQFGWEYRDCIPVPVVANCDPAPPQLIDIIKCQCKSHGKKCSGESCGCHKEHISCTPYCNCSGGLDCRNPFTRSEGTKTGNEQNFTMQDIGESVEKGVRGEMEGVEEEVAEDDDAEEDFENAGVEENISEEDADDSLADSDYADNDID